MKKYFQELRVEVDRIGLLVVWKWAVHQRLSKSTLTMKFANVLFVENSLCMMSTKTGRLAGRSLGLFVGVFLLMLK